MRLSFFVHFISDRSQRKGLCRASPLDCRNKEKRPIAHDIFRGIKGLYNLRQKTIANVAFFKEKHPAAFLPSFAIRKRLCYIMNERSGL